MTSEKNFYLDASLLSTHVREGRRIKIFDNEDMAAEFISIVKMYDPQDEFIYVIFPHAALAGKFIIRIFSPLVHFTDGGDEVLKAMSPPVSFRAIEHIRQKKAA